MRFALPLEVLASIRLSTWLALLDTHGYPAGTSRADVEASSPLDVTTRLLPVAEEIPLAIARALVTIVTFSTEDARRDVYNAADALAHPHRWPDASSPADLVAGLLAEATRDPRVAKLLRAAGILRDRSFRARSKLVYFGPSKPARGPLSNVAPRLGELVASWCASRDLGAVVSVSEAPENALRAWTVLHEDHLRTYVVAARSSGASALDTIAFRPVRSHLVTYAHARRRLEITTDALEAATPLALAMGVALFDNPRHFLDSPAVDLWKLQELGPASLSIPELAGEVSVSAIGGGWDSGEGHAITPRGRDLFEALARYKIRIEGGRLDLVTLRATRKVGGGGPPQCDVALRPPHLCTVSEPELAPLLEDFLDRARVTDPEPRARDFIARQPWIDNAAGWIEAEGEEDFASLVARGILKPNPQNRAVRSPDHPHAGRTATAYPLHGTTYLAWSPDATVAPFLVEERDLVVYALQFGKLAAAIAEALGLEGPAKKRDEDGVLYCGKRKLGPTYVLVFLLTYPIRATTAERLRDLAGHGHALLIAPEGRAQPGGLRQIAMPKLAGPWRPLLADVARALRVEDLLDATIFAPPDARFVLQRATGRVWLDGVACAVTERHFRLLEIFLQHEGHELHTKDIADHVARGRAHEDTTRKQIDSLFAALEKSFKAAKQRTPKDLRALIAMPRLGYYVLRAKGHIV